MLLDPETKAMLDRAFAPRRPDRTAIGGRTLTGLPGLSTGRGLRVDALPAADPARMIGKTLQPLFAVGGSRSREAASAMTALLGAEGAAQTLLAVHAEARGADKFVSPVDWLRPIEMEGHDDPARHRYGFSAMLAVSALTIALGPRAAKHVDAIVQIAFGVDPVNSTIRQTLLDDWGGRFDPTRLGIEIPPKLLAYLDMMGGTCVGSLRDGIAALGQASGTASDGIIRSHILNITPDRGCAGTLCTLRGMGFGATQPANARVLFTRYGGVGTLEGRVISWSDTVIEVEAPADVGDGPVRLVGMVEINGGTTFAEAANTMAGAANACLGPGAGRVIAILGRMDTGPLAATVEFTPVRFHGGPPFITFTGNGQSPTVLVRYNAMLHLEWDVVNAADVRIETMADGQWIPPFNRVFPPRGSLDIGPLAGNTAWKESIRLTASNGCGDVQAVLEVDMKDRPALVLAGGGSKGAFEVGAVRCLYDVFKFEPDVIAGASAGALNAVKLAEGRGSLASLEQMWLDLQGPPDMFVPTPRVINILRQWGILGIFPQQQYELSQMLGAQISEFSTFSPEVEFAIGTAKEAFAHVMDSAGIFLVTDVLLWGLRNGIALAKLIDEIKALIDSGNSLFVIDPVRARLDANVDPGRVANSGITLRIAVVDLNSGRARYVNERGKFIDNIQVMPLLDAVQASASIPLAFPPVVNGAGTFADGGVRENLPMAIADLAGASTMICVVPSPTGMQPKDYSTAKIFPIVSRTIEAIMDEQQLNDFKPHRGFACPTKIIAPSFEVHNLFTIDPGLIQINMDYGYMRAFDVMQTDDSIRFQLIDKSDEITKLRLAIWGLLEHHAEGKAMAEEAWKLKNVGLQRIYDAYELAMVRQRKTELRALFAQRQQIAGRRECNPTGIERAWQQWERHSWTPCINTPWDASTIHRGPPLQAVPPPPAL